MSPLAVYYDHLATLNGIRFTPREIDIIACILNGRSAKTIPSLLSIAPKTVAAHIENIRSKAGCSSRESIIDFVENSEKYVLIKNEYYLGLLTQISFEKCLRKFFKVVSSHEVACSLIYAQGDKINFALIHQLKQHLNLAGINVESKIKKGQTSLDELIGKTRTQQEKYILYISPDLDQFHEGSLETADENTIVQKTAQSLDRIIVLFLNNKDCDENIKLLDGLHYVNFSEQENYYFSFFKLLQIICPPKGLDKIYTDFKQQFYLNYPIANKSYRLTPSNSHLTPPEGLLKKIYSYLDLIFLVKKMVYVSLGVFFLFGLFLLTYHFLHNEKSLMAETKNETIKELYTIRSDLAIPTASSFLNRPELMAQIDHKLRGEKEIQSLALIGIGGAGKTTLARQYAQQQKAKLIWELNAETRDDLNRSFEKLAAALSKTDKDKKELRVIQDIKLPHEREEKLMQFVKTHLKAISSWFLIFDNVETLASIQNHFPQDPHTWGIGKVILTSRDHHFQNSSQINQTLFVGELNKTEKLNLFTKIMSSEETEPFTSAQSEKASQFLDNIPPFPLDISVAAYYLKSTHSSYSEYLEHIKKYKENFENFQLSILRENGSYDKTRYGIITLSLKEIIAKSPDFSDLLLFISLINAQNIPRDLLEKYTDPIVVSNFIYHLKKYSLIMNNSLLPCNFVATLSLHHSTQDISLPYLIQHLDLRKGKPLLDKISNVLDAYVDQAIELEAFPKMKMMAAHLEKFLTHSDLLTDLSKAFLESKLGSIYYFINEGKARKTLEDSFKTLNLQDLDRLSSEDNSRIARSFLHIGAVYTELKRDQEAENLFEKAISIYKKERVKNYVDLSWALSHLGNVHRRIGNYEKARGYLEESLLLNKQYGDNKPHRIARTLAYLGGTYRGLGFHQKALNNLEESLSFYKQNLSNEHFRIGWVLMQLGNVYRELGDNKKAKDLLANGLFILKKNLPENHISIGLILGYLGNCYRELCEYEKSRDHLEQSLIIYQKYSDENHFRIGWILFNLAYTYKALGNNQEAQKIFDRVLEIYTALCKEENIQTARLLRDMAGIFSEKNRLVEAEISIKKSLKILQSRNHIDTYKSLEVLGEIYLKKSIQPMHAKNIQENQELKNKAIATLNQSLKIAEQNFPKNSVHIERIRSKIKDIQKR